MDKLLAITLTILTSIIGFLSGVTGAGAHGSSVSISSEDGAGAKGCEDLKISFDGAPGVRAAQTITIPLSEAPELSVKMPSGSGIYVTGSDRGDYMVTVCKAADDRSHLDGVSVSREGGRISVDGPNGGDWVVYLLVQAPWDAALDVASANGPIDLRDLRGGIRARTQNGPLSLANCSGTVVASTRNGPIAFSGAGSNVDLSAQNGPLSVKLEGKSWSGGSLTARTQNGPLSLDLSSGFSSGVEVEASGHSPFSCHASACDDAEKSWNEDGLRVHFGGRETAVHLSTVNGPVSVGSGGDEI